MARRVERDLSVRAAGLLGGVDGAPVVLAKNEFYLGTKERAQGITFSSVKDVKKKG